MYKPDLIQTGMIDRTHRAYEYFSREQPAAGQLFFRFAPAKDWHGI
jgi:hypothetical protein